MKCVYRHRRLDNNTVFYIGLGNSKRPFSKNNRSVYWKNITLTHGYSVEIVAENLTKEDACELEEFLIQEYGRKDLGKGSLVNMTDGGDGVFGRSLEALARIGKSSSDRNKGKAKSEAHKLKISKSLKGRKRTGENIYKLPVLQFTKKGEFIKEWNSAEEAGKVLNIHSGNICSCRNNKRNSAGGFKWSHKKSILSEV